eukprot:gene17219-17411_t
MRRGGTFFLLIATTWCGVHWWVDQSAPQSPFLNLTSVLRGLQGALGGWCGLGLVQHALGILLWGRVGAAILRMEGLVARFLAGRLRVGGGRAGVVRVAAARVARVWPGGFAWLIRMAGWRSAAYGSQLRAVLETPEMVALLTASPQAGRVLRPICWMLGVEASLLRPGVVVVPKERVERVWVRKARVRVPIDFGRIPLPRGALAWAKREVGGEASVFRSGVFMGFEGRLVTPGLLRAGGACFARRRKRSSQLSLRV